MMDRIAIVDDDHYAAKTASWDVEKAGFEPIIIDKKFDTPDALANAIKGMANGAICDHRLSPLGYANFTGATVVAHLYDLRLPAILVTQFIEIDSSVTIRRYRQKIPILMSREDLEADKIRMGLDFCRAELSGVFASTRKRHRSLIRVIGFGTGGEEGVVDAIIPAWNPQRAVRFPSGLLSESLRLDLKVGLRLYAYVNIGADRSEDLYLDQFEAAPELAEGDETT